MTFEIIFAIALGLMLYTRIVDKHAMRVQLESVAKFLAFMAMVTCIRIAGYDFLAGNGIQPPGLPPELLEMGLWRLVLVFWEDAFYVLPIYLVSKKEVGSWIKYKVLQFQKKYLKKGWIPWIGTKEKSRNLKPVTWGLAVALSINFALGHAYQGVGGVLITMLYPYFISYRYGKKVGFGTVMICHILYDFITFYTVFLMRYLLPY